MEAPKALKPLRKRKLVDEMRGDWDVSIRWACRVFLVDTSTYHYKSCRRGQASLEQRIREICQTRVRYGCDESVIPSAVRLAEVSDELELDEVYATERQLLCVATTRARDRLFISGVAPGSEFLVDIRGS